MLVSSIDLDRVNVGELCREGKLGAVRYFLKKGVSVDKHAIYLAAGFGYLEIVKELVAYKAPVDEYVIYAAAKYGHLEIVRELIRYKAPADEYAIRDEIKEVLREHAGK